MVCDLPPASHPHGQVEIGFRINELRPPLVVVTRGLVEDEAPRLEVQRSIFEAMGLLDEREAVPTERLADLGGEIAALLAKDAEDASQEKGAAASGHSAD
jgi:hypothetical protein